MQPVQLWLDQYGSSHQNPVNKRIHWLCVPLIMWSLLGLLWLLHVPGLPLLNGAVVLMAVALLFYWRLSPTLFLAMAVMTALMLAAWWGLAALGAPVAAIAAAVFVLSWIAQFYGHKLEGKKPSFFQDVQFLLIGPLWVVAFWFRRQGWRY
ncbi:DUF962 domain-containing protein [Leeia sp.]|uniref:Mpo1 family 2-hydroxy fatty acid dioxygenase n=1 Tax=Leeia sp. TaxID=2884678 RepID=UPI0035B08B85